jgi:hypothetical protein
VMPMSFIFTPWEPCVATAFAYLLTPCARDVRTLHFHDT